jgi:hypothetical protein
MDYAKGDDGLEAIFHYQIKNSAKKEDHLFLAYIYPYNY